MIFEDYDPFAVGNYRWTEMSMWIIGIIAATIALFLIIDYAKTNKKTHLLWSIAMVGLGLTFYMVITHTLSSRGEVLYQGNWRFLVWGDYESTQMVITSLLMVIVPGLIATGLLYETLDDQKMGDRFLYFTLIMDVVVMITMMVAGNGLIQETLNPGLVENTDPIDTFPVAFIALAITQVPALLAIIILPIMKNKEEKGGYLLSIGALLMLVINALLLVVGFVATTVLDSRTMEEVGTFMGTAFAAGDLVDLVFAMYPFFMAVIVLCFAFGMIMSEKWGFSVPGIDFEKRQA
jgi:hypothetical protein